MCKALLKDLNVQNVKNKHSKDARNVNQFGTALEIAKLLIGQSIRLSATKKQNSFNNSNRG